MAHGNNLFVEKFEVCISVNRKWVIFWKCMYFYFHSFAFSPYVRRDIGKYSSRTSYIHLVQTCYLLKLWGKFKYIYSIAINSLLTIVILNAQHKVTAWVTDCLNSNARVLVHWCLSKELPCGLEQDRWQWGLDHEGVEAKTLQRNLQN